MSAGGVPYKACAIIDLTMADPGHEDIAGRVVVNGKVPDNKDTKRKLTLNRKVLFILVLLLIVIFSIGGYFTYRHYKHKPLQGLPTLNPNNRSDNKKLISSALQADVSQYPAPQKLLYYYQLANYYYSGHDYNNALTNIKKAEALNSSDASVLSTEGDILVKLGRNSEAKDYYQRAITEYTKMEASEPSVSTKINQLNSEIKAL